MKIKKCFIENFTVFGRQNIEFYDGVNVLIGTNGSGKSHLLKVLYSLVQSVPARENEEPDNNDILRFYGALGGVFKPDGGEVNNMIRGLDRKTPTVFEMQSDLGRHTVTLQRVHHIAAGNITVGQSGPPPWQPAQITDAPGIFIPPNEVLAIYPGFAASYEKRELSFDQTYYDICKALSAAPLRGNNVDFIPMIQKLEDVISGKVIQKGDRFYVQDRTSGKALEAHLVAEGHRKIATVIHLINNGSIDKNTILFWDEPEASLNPRLIKHIADFLRELASAGVQIFVATHDYLLTGELSLAAEYRTEPAVPIRFFSMSRREDMPVEIQCGETLADLHDNAILDEFAEHYHREEEAFIRYTRAGGMQ
mgnify:CR=1 FL=1